MCTHALVVSSFLCVAASVRGHRRDECTGNSTLAVLNETKVREFNRMLSEPQHPEVQRAWWSNHTPLEVIPSPFGKHCIPRRNGCQPKDPAFIRCGAAPGENRNATPTKTGGWPLCFRLLDISQAAHAMSDERSSALGTQAGAISRPLFYSFGLAGEWDPDDRLAGLGFEVHSFDPTERYLQAHRSHNVTGVHFHYTGLSTKASCQGSTSTSGGIYGRLGGNLLNLGQIQSRLGHDGASIAGMKIDCEGCEWDAFSHMAAFDHHAMDGIVMLMIEVHQVTSLKMAGHADFLKFQRFFEYIFEEQGFRFFFHHANWGGRPDTDVHPEMVRLGARPNHCCFEIGLVKPHLIEHLLAN